MIGGVAVTVRAQTFLCDILWLWRQAIILSRTHTGGSNLSVLTWPSQSVALPRGLHCWLDSICLHQNAISLLRYHRSPLLLLLPLLPSVSSLNLPFLSLISHLQSFSLDAIYILSLASSHLSLPLSIFIFQVVSWYFPGVFLLVVFLSGCSGFDGRGRRQ